MCEKNIRKIERFSVCNCQHWCDVTFCQFGQCSTSSELIKSLTVENIGRVIPIQLFKKQSRPPLSLVTCTKCIYGGEINVINILFITGEAFLVNTSTFEDHEE